MNRQKQSDDLTSQVKMIAWSLNKPVSMFGCYSKIMENDPKCFYTRNATEKHGELNGWDYDIVSIPVQTPRE